MTRPSHLSHVSELTTRKENDTFRRKFLPVEKKKKRLINKKSCKIYCGNQEKQDNSPKSETKQQQKDRNVQTDHRRAFFLCLRPKQNGGNVIVHVCRWEGLIESLSTYLLNVH